MDPVPLLWVAAAFVSWWIGAFAAGVRYDLVRLEGGEEPGEGYDLVSFLRRLRDDPVALGLRLRFSRQLSAAFVPLGLAAAVAGLPWVWTPVALGAGWLLAAAAEACGGGRITRRVGRFRGGLLYGLWARLTLAPVRVTRPLLRLRTEPLEAEDASSRVTAESQAALTAVRGRLGREERRLLRGLLASGSIRVGDIMTPWERVRWLDAGTPVAEALVAVHESGHSRLPVVAEGRVTGLVTAKDLLRHEAGAGERPSRDSGGGGGRADAPRGDARAGRGGGRADAPRGDARAGGTAAPPGPGALGDLLRPPYFVTRDLTGRDLLEELQAAHVHLAVVVDELGRLAGIVTMEDLLEEIVGELHDERERERSR